MDMDWVRVRIELCSIVCLDSWIERRSRPEKIKNIIKLTANFERGYTLGWEHLLSIRSGVLAWAIFWFMMLLKSLGDVISFPLECIGFLGLIQTWKWNIDRNLSNIESISRCFFAWVHQLAFHSKSSASGDTPELLTCQRLGHSVKIIPTRCSFPASISNCVEYFVVLYWW